MRHIEIVICANCGKKFEPRSKKAKYCSRRCANQKYRENRGAVTFPCPNNENVICDQHRCGSCGWNPRVAMDRLRKRHEAQRMWNGGGMMAELTHLSLFSGIGGLDLAAEWAGFQTVGQCEWADYPRAVLEKHWPGLPRWRDIRTLTKESFYEQTGLESVTVLSGGFPCQPFSTAGKRRGKEDDRYLWPEMLRSAKELRPHWIIGENVSGLVRMALDEILSSLEEAGYEARAYSSEARNVGGLFKGERIAIVAASDDRSTALRRYLQFQADGETSGLRDYNRGGTEEPSLWKRWEFEPRPYGVAYGVPSRVDRLKCLGNAVVPQQFYPIFRAIAEVEENYG